MESLIVFFYYYLHTCKKAFCPISICEEKDYCIPYRKRTFIHFKERNSLKYKRPFIRVTIFKQERRGRMTISQNRKIGLS